MSSFIQNIMSNKKTMWVVGIGVAIILIFGIGVTAILLRMISQQGIPAVATFDSALVFTQAVQTIQAEYTQQAADVGGSLSATPTPEFFESPTNPSLQRLH